MMSQAERQAIVAALAEAIPYALRGNRWMVISHLQTAIHAAGLEELDSSENSWAAARRAEANPRPYR